MRGDDRLALGVASVIGAAAIAGWRNYQAAKGEAEAAAALETLKSAIRQQYPAELADRVCRGLDREGPGFDIYGEAGRYENIKLYKFLLAGVGEDFADAFMARKAKFAGFEVETSLTDLFSRTLKQFDMGHIDGNKLQELFNEYLARESDAYAARLQEPAPAPAADPTRLVEEKRHRRATLVDDSTVHLADNGPVLITSGDFRAVYIDNGSVVVHADVGAFHAAYPRNRRWKHVHQADEKHSLIDPYIDEIMGQLYG